MLVDVKELGGSVHRYRSFLSGTSEKEIPGLAEEMAVDTSEDTSIAPEVRRGNIIGDEQNRIKRRQMLDSFGLEPTDFAFERAIGKNDSVYSNFIELLLDVKRKVGRIVVKDGPDNIGYATGFMISERLLMTNWHVFEHPALVGNSVVEFNYELDRFGNSVDPVTFSFDTDTFFYAFKGLDYCIIAVSPMDSTGTRPLSSIGHIYLDPTSGKLGDENAESLNIIHHPNGDYKQLSIRENKFTKILDTTLWYESDTAQGSSGAPVFNDQWQVVALHHMGVPKRNAQGDYLDKNNNVIPIVNNKIDVSRVHWIANEGIRISVILKDLRSKFDTNDPLLLGILETTATPQDVNQDTPSTQNQPNAVQPMETITTNNKIDLSIPSHLLDTHKKIDISLSVGHGPDTTLHNAGIRTATAVDSLAEESKRLERDMDYSHCKGYQIDFLSHEVALPLPLDASRHFAAKLEGTDSIVLNYFKFSVIHNAIKRMPFISAINVDGDPEKRLDVTQRNDTWIRDNRIDFDVQLNNDFYKKSGFDRGHMSRREDANWGGTAEQAKRNADLTCVHTNACPQVPSLNRSNRGGLWGKLEKEILEKGAEKEGNDTNKITVFSGPIFKESDPTFKGVQIPTEYYKVILWLDGDGSLKATGFTLSQVDLMDNIDFEAVDLDKNIAFAEHMRSLEAIQEASKIDFSHLFEFDTFDGNSREQIALDTIEMLREHIESHGTSKKTEVRKRRSKTKKD